MSGAATARYIRRVTNRIYGYPRMAGRKGSRTGLRRRSRRRRGRRRYGGSRTLVTPYSITRTLAVGMRADVDPAAASAPTVKIFNLNSLYDPTGSISGQQPLGFDQHMLLYRNYCVVGIRVRIDFCTTDNTNPVIVGWTPKTDATALIDPGHYQEAPGTVYKIMTPDNDRVTLFFSGPIKKWLMPQGGKMLTNDIYWGTSTSSPTSNLFGHLWAASLVGAGIDASLINYTVKLQFLAKFFNPIVPERS